jgi:HYR domain
MDRHPTSEEAVRLRKALVPALLLALAAVGSRHAAAFGAAGASSGPLAATGTFALAAELVVRYPPKACPPGTPSSIECFARAGSTTIRGLGTVTESYPYSVDGFPVGCAANQVRVLPAVVQITVAGKGELELRVDGSGCIDRVPPAPVQGVETFTITGGTGKYAGASGLGTIAHVSNGPPAWSGTDTWTGTLVVPGLEFDLTAPVLSGTRNRTVRAPRGKKRVRVKYAVSARDEVDGAIRAACRPKSGSWFKDGRTRVQCSATDTSGNESRAVFFVTVKRAR